MITNNKARELVEHVPDAFSIDDPVELVLILEKIEKAQQEIKNGDGRIRRF